MKEAKKLIDRIHKRDLYKILDSVDDTQDRNLENLFKHFLNELNVTNDEIGIIQRKIPSGEGNDDPRVTYFDKNGLVSSGTKFENHSVMTYLFVCKVNDTKVIEKSKKIIHNFIEFYKLK